MEMIKGLSHELARPEINSSVNVDNSSVIKRVRRQLRFLAEAGGYKIQDLLDGAGSGELKAIIDRINREGGTEADWQLLKTVLTDAVSEQGKKLALNPGRNIESMPARVRQQLMAVLTQIPPGRPISA